MKAVQPRFEILDDLLGQLVDALLARFVWLTMNRSVWRKRREIGKGLYSYNQERHGIFFRVSHDAMEIVRVLHARMDFGAHLVGGIDE